MSKNKFALPRLMHFISMLKENRYPNHPRLVEEMRKLDLAGAYNITQKTVQRDVNFLKTEYNAPIAYNFTERGYYLTDPEWNLDAPVSRQEEMEAAVLSSRLAEMILPNPVRSKIRQSIDELVAASDTQVLDDRICLLALIATGSRVPIKPEIFAEVFKGWRQRRILLMSYTRAKDGMTAQLEVEPHVLAFHEGSWYLKVRLIRSDKVAYEETDIITLAVHRISHVTVTPYTFTTDAKLLQTVQSGNLFDFPTIQNITLRLTGKGKMYGPEMFIESTAKELPGDMLELHIPEAEEYRLINFVLTWPGEVEVVSPAELREKIATSAEKILQKHKKS